MIIELSKFNSLTSFSNSDWINSFQPLTVQPGGALSFKSAFLDYNTTSQQVIELQNDVNIIIETGFYTAAPFLGDEVLTPDIKKYAEFDLYIARTLDPAHQYDLVKSSRSFTIPAGNYSPDQITEIINFNCVNINSNLHGSGCDFNNNFNNNFFRSAVTQQFTCALEPVGSYESNPVWKAQDISQLLNFKVNDRIGLVDYHYGILIPDSTPVNIEDIDYSTGIITFSGATLDYGANLNSPHMYLNTLYENPDIPNVPPVNIGYNFPFFRQATKNRPFDPSASFFYNPSVKDSKNNYIKPAAMMGCSQFQLEFNYNNNSLFQFSYLHTPFYTAGGDEAVDYYFMGSPFNNIFSYRNAITGIFFTKLEPASFWSDTLGFDLTNLVLSDDPVTRQLSSPIIAGVNITANLISYDAIFDKTRTPLQYLSIDGKVNNVEAVSNQTIAIQANKTQGISSSSFYLIELGGLSDVNMVNDTDLFRTICAIGSKQYNTQGVISIYPDGTPFFVNNSVSPIYLSSLRVRILDSSSKLPTQTLGEKNSVFLSLDNPPQQPKEEEEKKKK